MFNEITYLLTYLLTYQLGGDYNYDSTSIRLLFDYIYFHRATTTPPRTSRP